MSVDPFQVVRQKDPNFKSIFGALSDLNIRNEDGQNLLHEAAAYGNTSAGIELIQLGIAVNAQDKNGQTPLHYAGIHKNADLAREILIYGGDNSIVDIHGNTSLWSAAFNAKGDYGTVKVFAEYGDMSVANIKNKYGRSPLDFAKQISDAALIDILLKA